MNTFKKSIPWGNGFIVPFNPKAKQPPSEKITKFEQDEVKLLFSNIHLLVQTQDPAFIQLWGQSQIRSWITASWIRVSEGHEGLNRDAAFLRNLGEIAREEMAFLHELDKQKLEELNQSLKFVKDRLYTLGREEGMTDEAIEAEYQSFLAERQKDSGVSS
jgi:hypothetical protein